MPKQIRVRLVLEGSLDEVMDVVGLAMAGNLMKEYSVDEDHIPVRDVEEFMNPKRVTRRFQKGDRVVVNGAHLKYGVLGGEVGTVMHVYYHGRKSKVQVRWDDNHESDIGGSCLEVLTK